MIFKRYTQETTLEGGEYLFLVGNTPVHGYSLDGKPAFYDYTSLDVEDVTGYCAIAIEWELPA